MRLIGSAFACALLLGCSSLASCHSFAQSVEYEVIDGKLKVFGFLLEPRYPIPGDDYEGRVIGFYTSPDGRWVVIQSGYRVEVDLCLYDAKERTRPVRIVSEPGNHTSIDWHGDAVFEVSWGGMGYSSSELFRVGEVEHGARVDDMLLYDETRDIYAAFFMESGSQGTELGIEVGQAFSRERQPQRFNLELDFTYPSDARFMIDEIELRETELRVTHRRQNGEKAQVTLPLPATTPPS